MLKLSMKVLKQILPLFLVIISDPYRGINYDVPNSYSFTNSPRRLDISITESEAPTYEESYYEEESEQGYYESSQMNYYNTSQEDEEFYYFQRVFDY